MALDILRLAGIDEESLTFAPLESALWQAGHSASTGSVNDGIIVECGVLDHKRMADLDLKDAILAGTCCFTAKTLRKITSKQDFQPVSDFPPANRDIALVMDAKIPAGQVLGDIHKAANKACPEEFSAEDISIFDVYQGEHLPDGCKSLAFAISFRSMDRTLKEKEVNRAFDAISKAMTEDTPYELRS